MDIHCGVLCIRLYAVRIKVVYTPRRKRGLDYGISIMRSVRGANRNYNHDRGSLMVAWQ